MKKGLVVGALLIMAFFVGVLSQKESFPSELRVLLDREGGTTSKVFLITAANQCCRPIARLDKVGRGDTIFKTEVDFSDEDIENLRHSFSIPMASKIERMDAKWKALYLKINKKYSPNEYPSNYFIVLDNDKRIVSIERF